MVTNLVTGTVTYSSRGNNIGVSGLGFTPTGGMMLPKSLSIDTGYNMRLSAIDGKGYHYATDYEGSTQQPEFITTAPPVTISDGSITWGNNSGNNYLYTSGTYFYVVWREE